MNRFFSIFKTIKKTSTYYTNKKNSSIYLITSALALILIFSIFKMLLFNIHKLNYYNSFLQSFSVLIFLFLIFSSFLDILGSFYFSNDIESYLCLPIKKSEIFVSKFLNVYLKQLYVCVLILGPSFYYYCRFNTKSIYHYILSLVLLLLINLFALNLSGIFVFLLMIGSKKFKNKNTFKFIVSTFSVISILCFNLFFNKFSDDNLNKDNVDLLFSKLKILDNLFLGKLFVNPLFKNNLISSINSLLLIISIVFISFIIFLFVGNKYYFKGIYGLSSFKSNPNNKIRSKSSTVFDSKNVLINIIINDLKNIFRNSTILFEYIIKSFIMLIIFSASLFGSSSSQSNMFINPNSKVQILMVISMFVFAISLNPIFTTSFSRDKNMIYANKFLPISYKTQLNSKIIVNGVFNLFTTLIYTLLLVYFKFNFVNILFIIFIINIYTIHLSLEGYFYDLKTPKLNYDSERDLLRGFRNLYIAMYSLGYMLFLVVSLIIINNLFDLNIFIYYLFTIIFISIFFIIRYRLITNNLKINFDNLNLH